MLGRRESSQRMWKWRHVIAGTRTCGGRCGQGTATVLSSHIPTRSPGSPGRSVPARAPRPCPQCAAGAGRRARRAARVSGRGRCRDRAASAGRGEMWGKRQDAGGQRHGGHTGQGTHRARNRALGHVEHRGQAARHTRGRGTGMWRRTRTQGDPWGRGRRGGVAPRLPTHLNRTEILFSVAAMLYTSSSSRDEAWAGPRVGDAPCGVGDSRGVGDTPLPTAPRHSPTQHLPDRLFPAEVPSLPRPPLYLQVLVPLLSSVLSWRQVPVCPQPYPGVQVPALGWPKLHPRRQVHIRIFRSLSWPLQSPAPTQTQGPSPVPPT